MAAPSDLVWPLWTDFAVSPGDARRGRGEHWIHPRGRARGTYRPSDEHGLIPGLIQVNLARRTRSRSTPEGDQPSPSDLTAALLESSPVRHLIRFQKDFGQLGQTHLIGRPVKAVVLGQRELVDGDEVRWALDHAANVHAAMALALHRQAGDEKPLADLLRALGRLERQIPTVSPGQWRVPLRLSDPDDDPARDVDHAIERRGVAAVVRSFQGQLIQPNLGGMDPQYDPDAGASVRFKTLIQLIYWRVAERASTDTIRRCPCGALFFPSDERQKFCPPPPGRGESRCGKRIRQPRYGKT